MEINVPVDVQYILNKLVQSGYEAYIIGGCVRDSIMGIKPHDWDICTSALPQEVSEVFAEHKIIPTGLQHGTITIVLSSGQYEVTTYRIDGEYNDNRHPDNVRFTGSLIEDLKRRDFTINALAYNPEKGLIDFFDGVRDIKNKVIRCVGNPEKRFTEDALRMLRAVRFATTLSFKIDKKTLFSLLRNKHLLKNISIERINSEITKILRSSGLNKANIVLMLVCLKIVLPELKIPRINKIYSMISLNYYLPAGVDGRLVVRLASLFGNNEALLNDILKKMRYDNSTIKKATLTYRYGEIILKKANHIPERDITYFIRKMVSEIGYDLSMLVIEYVATYDYNLYLKLHIIMTRIIGMCNSIGEMKINGNDLISLNYSGKQIGLCLEYLLDDILRNNIENDHELLISKAKDLKKILL